MVLVRFFGRGFLDLRRGIAVARRIVAHRATADARRIAEAEEALRRSERRFRLLIERSADFFLVLDGAGYLRYVSPSAQAALGYPPEELVGTSALSLVHPEDGALALSTLGEIARAPGVTRSTEVRCLNAAGEWRWFEAVGVNLLDEPAVAGIVATLRDVTERRRIAAEREEALARAEAARAEAEEAVRQRDDFLSIAAHELKTPITSLRIAGQLLLLLFERGTPADSPRVQNALQAIDQQSVRLTQLVVQLLEISRLRLGRLVLNCAPTNLAELVRGAVEQVQARTSRHTLVLAVPAELTVSIDAARFDQVLVNLLDNAIKYSPDGGQIDVVLATAGPDRISLTVRDRGIGIPPDRRDSIFDLFYQAHRDSHQSGMGIGLFVSRQIVELHGGQIGVEFPEDGGTRFRVDLPSGRCEDSRPPP